MVIFYIGIGIIILMLGVIMWMVFGTAYMVKKGNMSNMEAKIAIIKAIVTTSPIPKMKVNNVEINDDKAMWEAEMRERGK